MQCLATSTRLPLRLGRCELRLRRENCARRLIAFDGPTCLALVREPKRPCPECRKLVFYYQSVHGGRVFFDQLGPPWPKHSCTDRRTWNWGVGTGFELKEGVTDLNSSPDWQHDGWAPVAKLRRTAGRPTSRARDSLTGAIVWSAADTRELNVLWSFRSSFDWSGPVMMRPDPRSPYRVVFETIREEGDVVRVQRLIAVKNDVLTTVPTLLSRLRDKR